jgi:hypothetical protein
MLALGLALVCGCGSARVINQAGNTGTIELSGQHHKAMDQANAELEAICGPHNANIVSQGMEGSGDDAVWRIHFMCGAAVVAPLPPIATPAT